MAANTLIQVRRGTASDWTTTNPTLASGEIGYETNTGKFKIGDGSVVWASLAYSAIKPSDLDALIGNYVGTNLVGGPGITVAASSGAADYIISLSDPTIQVSNITDLTASAAELNLLDGVTATTTELNYVDVTTAGTAQASKAVILDANKDITGIRHITLAGDLIVNGTTTTLLAVLVVVASTAKVSAPPSEPAAPPVI